MNAERNIAGAPPSDSAAWYALFVLIIAYTLSFIDRTVLALLVQPIQRDLGISDTQMSLLHGFAFAVFYTLLGIPIARAADRHSRRTIMAIGIAFWSIATALCGIARNFGQLFLARVGVGVGEAALSPAAYSMLADLFPKEKLGRALGIYQIGAFGGAGLAFMIGGAVIALTTQSPSTVVPIIGEIRSWQLVFFIVGLPGLLVALWVMTLREPPRRGVAPQAGAVPIRSVLAYLRQNARTYTCHFIGFSLVGLVFNGFMAWLPTMFVRRFDMAAGDAGLWLGGALVVFGCAGIVSGGLLADRWSRMGLADSTVRSGLTGAALMIPFAIAAPLMPTPTLSILMFCGFFFFSSFPYGGAAAALQVVTPPAMRAQISALFLFCLNMTGIGVGPFIIALFTDMVFEDKAMLHQSLAVVGAIAGPLGAIILYKGLRPFRASVGTLADQTA